MDKRRGIYELYAIAGHRLAINDKIELRAGILQQQGLSFFDSMHLALAEEHQYDVLLTTDDDFLAVAKRILPTVRVENPAVWFLEELP
jgi:predicted nucleic acid-binding protein